MSQALHQDRDGAVARLRMTRAAVHNAFDDQLIADMSADPNKRHFKRAESFVGAIEGLEPAQACAEVEHPNLVAWRTVLEEARTNPAREVVAVFVADLDDPVSSDVDGQMRSAFEDFHLRS